MGREVTDIVKRDEHTGKMKKDKTQKKAREEGEELKEGTQEFKRSALPRLVVPHVCSVCDGPLTMGGPIWNQPLHDVSFVQRVMENVRAQPNDEFKLGTTKRIQAILTGIIDEDPLKDYPLNYDVNYIASSLRCINPSKKEFVFAVNELGYRAIQTYYNSDQWKTNAPPEVLYDIFKVYKTNQCGGDQDKILTNLAPSTAGYRIF